MEQQYNFGHWGPTSEEILRAQFPLHRACRDGDLDCLSLLLVEAQHGIYEEDSFYGWTPAHWAAYFGKLSCLMRLLETHLDCDVSSIKLNQTSMHIAAFAGRSHCVKWLLHCGAKLDRQDYLGETAIHKAARTGSMECLSLLVSHGARLFIQSNNGQTAAQLSSSCGHVEGTRFLESAAVSQESQAKGVYASQPHAHARTTPSRHDVTSKVHACVIAQGINAGRLPAAGPQGDGAPAMTEECPMEEAEPASMVCPGAGDPVADITLHRGVSANVVSIGGRKRCREEADEGEHKRRRSDQENQSRSSSSEGSLESVETVISTTVSSVSDRSPPPPPPSDSLHQGDGPRHQPAAGAPPVGPDTHEPYEDVLALSTEPMKCICPTPPPSVHESNCWLVFV